MAKQERSQAVINAVLVEVGKRLMEGDEGTIRIPEICKATGVNYGSVYHHFGSRDGVIDAAYAYLLSTIVEQEVELINAAQLFPAQGQLGILLNTLKLNFSTSDIRARNRLIRLRVIAASVTRPLLHERVEEIHRQLFDAMVAMIERMKVNGVIRPEVSAPAVVALMQATLFGRLLEDLVRGAVPADEWDGLIAQIASSFLTDEIVEQPLNEVRTS